MIEDTIPDLRKELTPERITAMQCRGPGLTLSYATSLVTEPIIEFLWHLAQDRKVMEQMQAMFQGKIVNTTEQRSALHTALRIPERDEPLPFEVAAVARKVWRETKRLEELVVQLDRYTDVVQVGIGGSSLGPEAVYSALKAYGMSGRRAHMISNIDPDEVASVLQNVPLPSTLFVIVSKSGSTLETVTNEKIIRDALLQNGCDPREHLIAVTSEGSSMDDTHRYRAVFHLWDCIGGRYSVTSMVGGVMLAFTLGLEAWRQFLQGAHAMDEIALRASPSDNLPLMGALIGFWNRNYLHYPTVSIVPYSQALVRLTAHLQQLEMESNGKFFNPSGVSLPHPTVPVVWGEVGTSSQHSFFQFLHQGSSPAPVEFIGFWNSQRGFDLCVQGSLSQEKLKGNLLAQAIALAQGHPPLFPGNRPSLLLLGNRCDPFTLGALVAYYEHKVVFQGFLWGVNPFDQPGVELGKTLADTAVQNLVMQRQQQPLTHPLVASFLKVWLQEH